MERVSQKETQKWFQWGRSKWRNGVTEKKQVDK